MNKSIIAVVAFGAALALHAQDGAGAKAAGAMPLTEITRLIEQANRELRTLQMNNPSVLTRKQFLELYPDECKNVYKRFKDGEDSPTINIERTTFTDNGNFKDTGLVVINSMCYCVECLGRRGVEEAVIKNNRCYHNNEWMWHRPGHLLNPKEKAIYQKWAALEELTVETENALSAIRAKKDEIKELEARKEELKRKQQAEEAEALSAARPAGPDEPVPAAGPADPWETYPTAPLVSLFSKDFGARVDPDPAARVGRSRTYRFTPPVAFRRFNEYVYSITPSTKLIYGVRATYASTVGIDLAAEMAAAKSVIERKFGIDAVETPEGGWEFNFRDTAGQKVLRKIVLTKESITAYDVALRELSRDEAARRYNDEQLEWERKEPRD